MVIACPPYYDLEKYSEDKRDLSNMGYDEFTELYSEIIGKCVTVLKDNRFAVFVVGDIRDRKGFYRGLPDLTIKAFTDAGLKLYNRMVLVRTVGTGAIRARKQFAVRKVVTIHEEVLVFYKGDPKKIKSEFPVIEIPEDLTDPA
jgi:hypothetical protein